jgi:hypothetical protein
VSHGFSFALVWDVHPSRIGDFKAEASMGEPNHDRVHATHDAFYESELSGDNELIVAGARFNICETVSVARRETSRGSALYCAAWSKTASIRSPSETVFGVWVVMVSCLSWDAHSALLFREWRSAFDLHMHLQHIPGHQLEGNEFTSLHLRRFLVLACSFKVK